MCKIQLKSKVCGDRKCERDSVCVLILRRMRSVIGCD